MEQKNFSKARTAAFSSLSSLTTDTLGFNTNHEDREYLTNRRGKLSRNPSIDDEVFLDDPNSKKISDNNPLIEINLQEPETEVSTLNYSRDASPIQKEPSLKGILKKPSTPQTPTPIGCTIQPTATTSKSSIAGDIYFKKKRLNSLTSKSFKKPKFKASPCRQLREIQEMKAFAEKVITTQPQEMKTFEEKVITKQPMHPIGTPNPYVEYTTQGPRLPRHNLEENGWCVECLQFTFLPLNDFERAAETRCDCYSKELTDRPRCQSCCRDIEIKFLTCIIWLWCGCQCCCLNGKGC